MPWNESFSVGVTKFDNEHKRLIALVDELAEAMHHGKGKDVLSKTLAELIKYTDTHFKSEEQAMQKHGYPGYESQKHQHDEFVSKVVGLKEDYESGKALISLSMLSFLTTWVNNHIKKEDKQYGPFFAEKGLN